MKLFGSLLAGGILTLFAAPTSSNYALNSYDFGTGGGTTSSTNYGLNTTTGTQAGVSTSTNYAAQSGIMPANDANVPPAATLSNPSNYYNKLHAVISTGGNPTDAIYAIAISADSFATVEYVQSDNSISPSIGIEDFQSYTAWGSGSGFDILGLASNTSYQIRVAAMQGNATQSTYGPASAVVATSLPSISFTVETTLSATPPFTAGFGSLVPGTVVSANADPAISLSTNSVNGGTVYIRSTNAGLVSSSASSTLSSTTADLASTKGYGAQVTSIGQTSGGPFVSYAPFNGAADNVGALQAALVPILGTTTPLSSGTATVRLKAKSDITVPAASDYADTVTFIAGMNF